MTCRHGADTAPDLALCPCDQHTLRVALTNVAAYFTDVAAIRPGQRVKTRSTYQSTPPPATGPRVDPIATVLDATALDVNGWCRALLEDRPQLMPPPVDTARRCSWLEEHIGSIATLDWAGDFLGAALKLERDLLRELTRADAGTYLGPCGYTPTLVIDDPEVPGLPCQRSIYAAPRQAYVDCPDCRATHDVAARHQYLLDAAREQVAPVRTIARAVVGLLDTEISEQRLTRRIEQWVARGRLRDLGVRVVDGQPRRVYNLGEVVDLLDGSTATTDTPAASSRREPAVSAC